MSPRNRLAFIYFGLLVLAVASLILHRMGDRLAYVGQPVERGVAVVVAKESGATAGQDAHLLRLRVETDPPWEASAPVPEPAWSDLDAADRVAVLFQLRRGGGGRIVECGLLALPDENQ